MAVDQVPHHIEKPAEIHRTAPQVDFHPHELLSKFNETVGSKPAGVGEGQTGAASTGAEKGVIRNGKLEMSDPFAGLQGGPEERAVKGGKAAKGHDAPAAPDKPAEKPGAAKPEAAAPAAAGEPIKIVGTPKDFDPKKPTVAVLDNFGPSKVTLDRTSADGQVKTGPQVENHGEITARAAEANGFNVYRVQAGSAPLGEQMAAIDGKIKSGELPLRKGDAVNVSLGPAHDLPVDGFAKYVGANATNDTLRENKDQVLAGVRAKGLDPKSPIQSIAADVTKSNDAISDIQSQGIAVLHAAGNEGHNTLTPHFLNATELNSTKPNGQADSFSADSNNTVKADGVLPVTSQPPSMFSSTPLYNDRGSYKINLQNGKSLDVPITQQNQGWMGGDRLPFDRNSYDGHNFNPTPVPNEQPTSLLSPNRLGGDGQMSPYREPLRQNFDNGQLKPSEAPHPVAMIYPQKVKSDNANLSFTDTPSTDSTPRVAGVIAGTSFSNIGYLAEHHDEMERLKNGGN